MDGVRSLAKNWSQKVCGIIAEEENDMSKRNAGRMLVVPSCFAAKKGYQKRMFATPCPC